MSRLSMLTVRLLCAALILAALTACGSNAPEPTAVPTTAADDGSTADAAATTVSATAPDATPTPLDPEKTVTTASGLQYTETVPGDGPQPQPGDVVTVHYTGKLQDGTVFDSSFDRDKPIRFALGQGMVIRGWDEGIGMMHKGGQATLVIPPDLAYGESGAGGVIPPNATLIFDVQLIDIQPGAPAEPSVIDESAYTTTAQGLTYADIVVGDGPRPRTVNSWSSITRAGCKTAANSTVP